MKLKHNFSIQLSLALLFVLSVGLSAQNVLTASELLVLKSAGLTQLSPDGSELIYYVSTPRGPNDPAGGAKSEYFRMSLADKSSSPLFGGKIKGGSPRYSPDGKYIGFLYAKKGEARQVWIMPANGGDTLKLTHEEGGVSSFRWQPGKRGIGYTTKAALSGEEKELKERGYDFIYYEENLKNNMLHVAWYDENWKQSGVWQLTEEGNTWNFEFNAQGTRVAASISPKNLIDHMYMFRRIYLIDLSDGTMKQISQNEGKLGNYAFSPDGKHIAYAAALNINDHQVSQAFVADVESGKVTNYTAENYRGHVNHVDWKDSKNLLYTAGEGVYPKLYTVNLGSSKRVLLLDAEESGLIFSSPKYTPDFKNFVFSASTPYERGNIYHWNGKNEPAPLTEINPELAEKTLGKQEVISYRARDGMEIEGLMIHPVDYQEGKTYPLIVYVHGGPESHHSNGWLSRYSTPAQVMAGKGYLVMYLNYRASTGYGVDFGMEGFMDPAGKEFDDIADAIEFAVREKGADPERVGLAGGSYGGYASAWFATFYTKYVKAVCMFVGISNNISKRGTTDIAYEELYVHSGKKLEEQWQLALERSPVYWAHQSKTATLIYGGAADTRVHPSQSFELYRRMKMNDHPAVRLVQYPGEGHGNRKQVGQIDVLYRQMEWLDWYVKDLHPLDGPMPRLDISDRYGLDWSY
ncbi:MAG: S9 family peptidase [Bacteroidota bacterium]